MQNSTTMMGKTLMCLSLFLLPFLLAFLLLALLFRLLLVLGLDVRQRRVVPVHVAASAPGLALGFIHADLLHLSKS